MTARFAGSQELGQRRRRRLAQDALTSCPAPGPIRTPRQEQIDLPVDHVKVAEAGPRLPRETMIPGSWVKIGTLGGIGAAVWGLVVWLGVSSWSRDVGIADLVAIDDGPLVRFFSTVALLLTAQLSLLIYWHRSRSRKDFMGRYRIWGWAGMFWGLLCLANATGFHRPLVALLNSRWMVNCWRGEEMYWFAPLAVGVLALYRLMGREMSPSRASTCVWNITFIVGLVVASLHLGAELLLAEAVRPAVVVSLTTLWHYLLALSCLVHARYVTHVTNEAAGKRPSMTTRLSRWVVSSLRVLGERLLSIRLPKPPMRKALSDAEKDDGKTASQKNREPTRKKPALKESVLKGKSKGAEPVQPADAELKSGDDAAAEGTAKSPGRWVSSLRKRVLGRWVLRSDEAHSQEVSQPKAPGTHQKTERPAPRQAKPVPEVSPQLEAAEPVDSDVDVSSSRKMTKQERRRLKKQQRQRARQTT